LLVISNTLGRDSLSNGSLLDEYNGSIFDEFVGSIFNEFDGSMLNECNGSLLDECNDSLSVKSIVSILSSNLFWFSF